MDLEPYGVSMDVKEESGVVICQTPDRSHFKTMEYFKPFIISQYGNSEAGAGVGSGFVSGSYWRFTARDELRLFKNSFIDFH